MVANELAEMLLLWANQLLPDELAGSGDQSVRIAPPFKRPSSALVIPSLFIGDNILLTPFLRNLRWNLGERARIDLVANPSVFSLFETLPEINRVHLEKQGALRKPVKFLKESGYDTIFFCRYSPVWAAAGNWAQIPQRVGFSLERLGLQRLQRWGRCLTHVIPSTSIFDSRPQMEIYLSMLQQLGLTVTDDSLLCPVTEDDRQQALQQLALALSSYSPHAPRILIHASAGSPGKLWPFENWQTLLNVLDRRFMPVFFALGSAQEEVLYKSFEESLAFVNLCGRTSLRESLALLTHMDMVITLDTSIAHMAAAAGVPRLVSIYGPTNYRQWRPHVRPGVHLEQVFLELACRPCLARTCEHKRCIQELSVLQVMQAIERCVVARPFEGNNLYI